MQSIHLLNKTAFVKLDTTLEDTWEFRAGITGRVGHAQQTSPTRKRSQRNTRTKQWQWAEQDPSVCPQNGDTSTFKNRDDNLAAAFWSLTAPFLPYQPTHPPNHLPTLSPAALSFCHLPACLLTYPESHKNLNWILNQGRCKGSSGCLHICEPCGGACVAR